MKASDLLSAYIGETEQNFAKAFRTAERDNALLMIDEVDSFLQDRRGAQRSCELTEVNEFLTQMESFPGIFIASTNLIDNLDQAALRRFGLKSKFDFLKPDQAWALFKKQCEVMRVHIKDRAIKSKIHSLTALTPGDFAAVLRQHRLNRFDTPLS